MKESGKSCLLMLLIYAGLTVLYASVLSTRLTGYSVPLAMVLAVFGSLFLGSLISVVTVPDETARIKAAMGGRVPRDRDLVAVVGRVVAEGGAEAAPLSGEPAVAWDCEIYELVYSHVQKQSRKALKYKGMARIPFGCETSRGTVAIRGLVDLAEVPIESRRAEAVWDRLQIWSADPRFEPFVHRWKGVTGYLEEFATEEDRYCRLREDPDRGLSKEHHADERVLAPGQAICALGVYDADEGALKGERVLGVERVRILPGSPRRVIARIRRKTWLGLLALGALFVLSHGVIGGVVFGGWWAN